MAQHVTFGYLDSLIRLCGGCSSVWLAWERIEDQHDRVLRLDALRQEWCAFIGKAQEN